MEIEVVLAFADKQHLVSISLPQGATIRQAAAAAFKDALIPNENSAIDPATVPLGIFGELEDDNYVLSAGDRVEIYRPLLQDPKEWRRQRAQLSKDSQ